MLNRRLMVCAVGASALLLAQEDPVFRSDVSLVRVDVQALDSARRTIPGLTAKDFELREEGKARQIRNFATEEYPVDILFLIDVSGSMRPHVERLANAAHAALGVLGRDDRVGMMVFDRTTRVRMNFREGYDELEREFDNLFRHESFNGGTDITRALYDAIRYITKQARKDARRAIVILTDDRTEFGRDDDGVLRALARADTVLSALIAPDAMGMYSGIPGPYPGGGGSWPRGGRRGGIIVMPPTFPGGGGYPSGGGWPRGGGGGWPGGGGQIPTGGPVGGRLQSAGTSEIAEASGGDSFPVSDGSALETTLQHIRQRYALHFLEPPGTTAGQQRNIYVQLTAAARRRYPGAELKYRTVYIAQGTAASPDSDAPPTEVSAAPGSAPAESSAASPAPPETPSSTTSSTSSTRRRPAVDEPGTSRGPRVADAPPPPVQAPSEGTPGKGWRKLQPGEKP